MTTREQFVMAAMQSAIAGDLFESAEEIAGQAVKIADATLAAMGHVEATKNQDAPAERETTVWHGRDASGAGRWYALRPEWFKDAGEFMGRDIDRCVDTRILPGQLQRYRLVSVGKPERPGEQA